MGEWMDGIQMEWKDDDEWVVGWLDGWMGRERDS